MKPKLFLVAVIFAGVAVAVASRLSQSTPVTQEAAPTWETDLPSAMRAAKASGKDLLIEFSLRETPAPSLDRQVFDQASFRMTASKRFVLIRLAVATDPAEVTASDARTITLSERYGVARIPGLVLADSAGRPYAAVEDASESVDAQLKLIDVAADHHARRDASLALAAKATGAERAKQLDAALDQVGRFGIVEYETEMAEIVALDFRDDLKLKTKYETPLVGKRIDSAIQSTVYPMIDRADLAGAMAALDKIRGTDKLPAVHEQSLLAFKAQLLCSLGRPAEAKPLFEKALALAPQSPRAETIRQAIAGLAE